MYRFRKADFRQPARGFTLVELLVVIVIIGILIGILLAALGPTRTTAQNFAITQEINQLEGAFEKFKTKFGFYPPSTLGDLSNSANPEFGVFKSYLRKIAPNHAETDNQIIAWWNQAGQLLDNDAMLVFWLSGLNKSSQYPLTYNLGLDGSFGTGDDIFTAFAVGEDPYKYVFFDFKSNRMQDVQTGGPVLVSSPPDVADTKAVRFMQQSIGEQPYVFFSSQNYDVDNYVSPISGEAILPYASQLGPPIVYFNPDKFQIVAAGVDRLFGTMPGGDWRGSPQFRDQRNNITNFTEGILEKATQ